MPKIAIIGTTSWGMTLAMLLPRDDISVSLWARTAQEVAELRDSGPNLVPGAVFPPQLSITDSISEALSDAKAVILAVPSRSVRQNIKSVSEYLNSSVLIISAAKGLELESNKRMSQVIAEEVAPWFQSNICVLSGPNLSQEILRNLPAAAVVAAGDEAIARQAQKLLTTANFCVYTNTDVIGVELGGALKNIIALGAGMVDGLNYGDNAKAALITRGLTEMAALGVTLGANPLTLSGLSGLGDLIATCASPLSRNHYVGVELTKGRSIDDIINSMTGVAEGVNTTIAVWNLAQELQMEMPVTEKIYRVLTQNAEPRQVITEILGNEGRHELAGRSWKLFSFARHRSRT